jgi:hypothetical protein
MRKITIKPFSACEAAEFFSQINPFMFHDDRFSSYLRKYSAWHFKNHKTGETATVRVDIPDNCDLIWDNEQHELRFDAPSASLALEYAIVDGVRIPAEQSDRYNCVLDTNL